MTEQCFANVAPTGNNYRKSRRCFNRGKVKRKGRWYCAHHDPEHLEQMAQERRDKQKHRIKMRRIGKWGPKFKSVLKQIADGADNPHILAAKVLKDFDWNGGL